MFLKGFADGAGIIHHLKFKIQKKSFTYGIGRGVGYVVKWQENKEVLKTFRNKVKINVTKC